MTGLERRDASWTFFGRRGKGRVTLRAGDMEVLFFTLDAADDRTAVERATLRAEAHYGEHGQWHPVRVDLAP